MGLFHQLADAQAVLSSMGAEFACITNAPGVFPPRDILPLGPRVTQLDGPPAAIFLDMDGTTTFTEPLFLHDVEEVVRRATGWYTKEQWAGIDPERDHPRIVGYSTIRNLEYLYEFVGHAIQPALFFAEAMKGLIFLNEHPIPEDVHVRINLQTRAYGMEAWRHYAQDPNRNASDAEALICECIARFPTIGPAMFANFGLMIFYADFIDMLERVVRGEGASVSAAIYGDATIPAISAMPGIALLCALAKGWLPESHAQELAAVVRATYPGQATDPNLGATLARLCAIFRGNPVPVALVTSSGAHETNLVLQAVFLAMRAEANTWPLPESVKQSIVAGFDSHRAYFDTIVTCNDVIEGRTKPFRDAYSIALERLDISSNDAARVIGFEDTEAGIIAQRGAGIGVACAAPIEHTRGQDFLAASHVLPGGVLEAIGKGLFLS